MTKKRVQKVLMVALLIIATAKLGFGQINLEPKINEISSEQKYVIVLKGNGSTNAKVLMSDGNASSFDFDPNNLAEYPTWSIKRIKVNRGPNVAPLSYLTLQCNSNQKYFAYGNKGDDKMMSNSEYEKYWEKDPAGNNKYDISDMYHFVYREYVEDDNKHIRLTYHSNKEESSTSQVYLKSWPSDKLKLVLVKL